MSKEKLNSKDQTLKDQSLKDNLETYQNNKDLIDMYDEYVRRIVELFSIIIKNNSDLYYSIVFSKMLHSGYFSVDKMYRIKNPKNELRIKYGMNIVNGDGVCRNIAWFYSDIFKHFYNYVLRLCCFYVNPEDSEARKEKDKTNGNHIINLAKYYDEIYGIDITNQCLFRFGTNSYLEGIDVDYNLEHKPRGDVLLNIAAVLSDKTNVLRESSFNSSLFTEGKNSTRLTIERIRKMSISADSLIEQKAKLLKGFMIENEELTHEIKRKMLSIK